MSVSVCLRLSSFRPARGFAGTTKENFGGSSWRDRDFPTVTCDHKMQCQRTACALRVAFLGSGAQKMWMLCIIFSTHCVDWKTLVKYQCREV